LENITESNAILKLPDRPGLMHGFSGAALLFIHLYEQTNDNAFLEFAASALRRDLSHCEMTPDGTLQVRDAPRVVAYLATGSAGIGVVLHRYLRHRSDDEFAEKLEYIKKACQAEFAFESGLFRGKAGFIACLCHTGVAAHDPIVKRHLRRLAWHAMPYRGHLGFPGEYLLRLSMDLATGSAGVMLALYTALREPGAFLPFLDSPGEKLL
jgi:lantibiotic modifying enzyme